MCVTYNKLQVKPVLQPKKIVFNIECYRVIPLYIADVAEWSSVLDIGLNGINGFVRIPSREKYCKIKTLFITMLV